MGLKINLICTVGLEGAVTSYYKPLIKLDEWLFKRINRIPVAINRLTASLKSTKH